MTVLENLQRIYLLARQGVIERPEHIVLIFDSELYASFFVDALLPAHVMALEHEWLRSHFTTVSESDKNYIYKKLNFFIN